MTPRGIRNNNPGNIRAGEQWQGLTGQDDAGFCTFDTPEHGIRALCKVLLSYYNTHGLRTVWAMISRWAPPNENDTQAYVNAVAAACGVSPDADFPLTVQSLPLIAAAIIAHENGQQPYTAAQLTTAAGLALGNTDSRTAPAAITPPPPQAKEVAKSSEAPMAEDNGILGIVGDVAASFIPGGPLIKALAGKLISAFAPLARDKIISTLGRHDVDPAIGGQVADGLVQAAMSLTNTDDPVDAVSAATKDQAILAQLQQHALERVQALAPVIDKLNEYEHGAWDASEESIDRAAKRSNESTVSFWQSQVFAMVVLIMPIIYYAVFQVLKDNATVSQELKSMALGFVFGTAFSSIIQYFFGTSRTSAAKDAQIAAIASAK